MGESVAMTEPTTERTVTLTQIELNEIVEGRLAKQRSRASRDFNKQTAALRADLDGLRAENTTLRAELDDLWPRPRRPLGARLRQWFTAWRRTAS